MSLTYLLKRKWYQHTVRDVLKTKFSPERLREEGYMSQYGQDKYINEKFFKNKNSGVFIDIGANDGISLSNTCFFEKTLKWDGIAIEPLPPVFKKLQTNRNCTLINACVSDTDGKVSFMMVDGCAEMLSGVVDDYDPQHLKRIKRSQKKFGDTTTKITVPSFNLSTLLKDTPFHKIDYMSIDTEGGEFKIIQSIDLTKYFIKIISIENNYSDTKFRRYMDDAGYDLVAIIGDEIYCKRE